MSISKTSFLFSPILVAMFFIVCMKTSLAQSTNAGETSQKSVIMNGKISFVAPGPAKKVKKKSLKAYRPCTDYKEAEGSTYKNGDKILFYHTDINWTDLDNGIKIWDFAYGLAEGFEGYKFMKSGYYQLKRGSSVTYFLKISGTNKKGNFYALLTFSALENKLLYGVYVSPQDVNDNWINSGEESPPKTPTIANIE